MQSAAARMSGSPVVSAIGLTVVLVGLTLPSPAVAEGTTSGQAAGSDGLLLGAVLLKIGLIGLGAYTVALGLMPWWTLKPPSVRRPLDRGGLTVAALGCAVLAAACALRLHALDRGLWYDEIITCVKYARLPPEGIISTFDFLNQHILYSLMAHGCFAVFGESAWALRLPAVLFGVASIGAIYLLGKEVSGRRESFLAAALLAFSYHHLWFSQNARGYTGILFWTIACSWLLLRALRDGDARLWALYGLAAALGVYTQLTMLFTVIAHFAVYLGALWRRRRETRPGRWAGLFAGFCLAGLLTFVLYAMVVPQMIGGTVRQGAESTVAEWKNPLWMAAEIANGMKIGLGGTAVAVGALVVVGLGLLSYAKRDLVFLQLAVLPVVVCAVALVVMDHPLRPRLLFFAFGSAALIVVRGAMELGRALDRIAGLRFARGDALGTVLCLTLIAVSAASLPAGWAPKQDFQAALDFVQREKVEGDKVAMIGPIAVPFKRYYGVDWETVKSVETLNSVRSGAKRTWVLYTFSLHVRSEYPQIMETIRRDFRPVKEFRGSLGDGTIFLFRSDRPPSWAMTAGDAPADDVNAVYRKSTGQGT